MIDKASLINAIYAVEINNDSRLAGLIIEHYFIRKLKVSFSERGYSDVQSGWIIQKLGFCSINKECAEDEHWYRLVSPAATLSAVDHTIINTFSRAGRRFFSIEYTTQPFDLSSGAIKLTVIEIGPFGKSLSSPLPPPNLQQSFDKYLKNKKLNKKSGLLSKWFHHFHNDELELAFIQRCIMNSMDNCVDIDAVALCKNNKKLTFFEFKRKYPAMGARKFTFKFTNTFPIVSSLVLNITQKMNNYKATLATTLSPPQTTDLLRKEFDRILPSEYLNEYAINRNAFYCGLDWSHYQILNMCENAMVNYKYLIWNFNPKGEIKASKKSPTYEDEILSYLLTPNSSKTKHKSFLQATLSCNDAKGLTFTEGSDSGKFSNDVRLQIVFSLTQ